jgi:hypothetical protein
MNYMFYIHSLQDYTYKTAQTAYTAGGPYTNIQKSNSWCQSFVSHGQYKQTYYLTSPHIVLIQEELIFHQTDTQQI